MRRLDMADSILTLLTLVLVQSLVFLPEGVAGKPSVSKPPPVYPYSLSYKLGEFQGYVYDGDSEGAPVIASTSFGHGKKYPECIGVDIRKSLDGRTRNPFLSRNSIGDDARKNATPPLADGIEVLVLGTAMFRVSGNGDILVHSQIETSHPDTVYFSVVLVRTEDGSFRSNPLSFVVTIAGKADETQPYKSALTAGILVLLILILLALTVTVVKFQNSCEKMSDEQKSVSSGKEEDDPSGVDWKDHYHIKMEDSVIMEKDHGNEASPRNHKNGCPPLLRSDSSLSWLKLHSHTDEDGVDSGNTSLPTIYENCDDSRKTKTEKHTHSGYSNGYINVNKESCNRSVNYDKGYSNGSVNTDKEFSNGSINADKEFSNGSVIADKQYSNGSVNTDKEFSNGYVNADKQYSNDSVNADNQYSNGSVNADKQYSNGSVNADKQCSNGSVNTGESFKSETVDNTLNKAKPILKKPRPHSGGHSHSRKKHSKSHTPPDTQLSGEL